MSASPKKMRYKGVRFNVISVTRGWVGVKFPGKKRYVTLEWPLKYETRPVMKAKVDGTLMIWKVHDHITEIYKFIDGHKRDAN